ncbi:MAG: hypothetical protein AAGH68_01715 [Pseudomonadota bacterium]
MDIIIIDTIDTDFFADQSDLMAWLGDDPKAYDPLERGSELDTEDEDACDEDALIDDDDVFDGTGDRFPFE